jgi:hypothetical protein
MEKDRTEGGNRLKRSAEVRDRGTRPRRRRGRPARVISIQDWKNRTKRESAAADLGVRYQEGIRGMSTEQKQAVLIRVIMSEDITQSELDLLLLALAAPA